ncbi:DHH family phosphoesterase [Paenibacillus lautus]|uniref:DHH family phosphoesterase n=1 Tax=Paenibacillus lautus TaxID=1401 RepID=UPI001C7D6647|nr:DHH family phosphoesterase [Paenibacillus lautus]MBX4152421.1 DHH family phosphoesterase [Paenibacillus lautus]
MIHSPYLLKNIDELVTRIIKAIKKNLKIIIFGDCDFDGAVSGIELYKLLLNFTDNVELKFVERSTGHGSQHIIEEIPDDTGLYIAVDSSSNDVEEMKYLASKGIECLIIDHHTVTINNPYAILVNPQQEGCKYPNKNSCGGLLVYKVCQVIDDYMNTNFSEKYKDLPGLALLADMMSMMEPENRYYVNYSLSQLSHAGLKFLFEGMNCDLANLTSTDFLYGPSPAITAATRLDNIKLAIDLLMCDELNDKIELIVGELLKANEYRKQVQAEALERLKPTINTENKVIIVVDPTLGKGLNGLVGQELSKYFNRPAIVLGYGEDDTYAGSYRGLEEFSMMDLLNECDNVIFAAGHAGAGGIGLKRDDLSKLQDELNFKLSDFEADNSIEYDLEFDVNEINEKTILQINDFYRISGQGIKPGKFLIKNVFSEDKKLMGKTKNTIKVFCGPVALMKFKADETYYNNFPIFAELDVVGTLNMNYWKKFKPKFEIVKTMQVFIEDYKENN